LAQLITRKRAEESLLASKEAAEAGERTKQEFLSIMSHEMRTPMNGVMGMADLLAMTKLDGEQQEYVDIVRETGCKLLELINDILELSRSESEGFEPENSPFSLHDLINGVITLLEVSARQKDLEISLTIDPDLPQNLIGDGRMLRQILLNLLGNALKFTDRGIVSLEVQEDCSDPNSKFLLFNIKDEGIGISKEQQEIIFQPFTQVDSSVSRAYQGSGLGLTICKRFIESIGGRIWVTSETGKGSTFQFTMPMGTEANIDKETTHNPNEATASSDALLLIVEDDLINQKVLSSILRQMGFAFVIANNGAEAIEIIQENPIDLVLMDCQMPVMNGFEATQELRKREQENGTKHLPVVAITAFSLKGDRERCLEAGMDEYLTKPVQRDKLQTMLNHFLPENTLVRVCLPVANLTSEESNERGETLDQKVCALLLRDLGEEVFSEVLNLFLEIVPENLKKIQEGIIQQDPETVHFATHSLKSSSRQLGAIRFSNLASELDSIARENSLSGARGIVKQLEIEAYQAIDALENCGHQRIRTN
jgi:two-component system, sensor histidine kinase